MKNIALQQETGNREIRNRTPEPPYSWQSKEARRTIRNRMDGDELQKAALSVYDAFTEIASNEGKESFTASQPHIGELAGGYSQRCIQRVLPLLREMGLIAYESPKGKLRGTISYSLLSVATVSRNDATPSRNDATGTLSTQLAYSRSNKEVTLEETQNPPKPPEGATVDSPSLIEVAGEEPKARASKPRKAKPTPETDPDFLRFWEVYPVKVAKSEAFVEWQKAKLPAIADIIAAVETQKAWRASAKGEFRPAWKHPSKWIKKGCWDDQVTFTEEARDYSWEEELPACYRNELK